MRMLFVLPSYVPYMSGSQAFVQQIAKRLISEEHEVAVLTTNARRALDFWRAPSADSVLLPPYEELAGIPVHRLRIAYPGPFPYTLSVLRRASYWIHRIHLPVSLQRPVLRWLSEWMPSLPGLSVALNELLPAVDLVHVQDSSWDGLFTAAVSAANRAKKGVVACPLMHLGDADVSAHFQMIHQIEAYRSAQVVLGLSKRELMSYKELGIHSQRLHLLHMGVDPIKLEEQSPFSNTGFKDEQGLEGPLIAFIGANTFDKGAFTLLRAVLELQKRGRNVNLVYAGSESEGLRAFIDSLPATEGRVVERRVRILGVVDEFTKGRLLAASDLLAMPSRVDTFGIVFLEAWSYCKPVIGAGAGGIPEVVRHGENGLLVPFGNVIALADAVSCLVTDKGLRDKMGNKGRQDVLTHYSWDRTYDKLFQIYSSVISKRR